ncbi:uncharacterized protein (DUF608 family) [Friedmanniella endophytica]|uniref:Uncharacterized protein (DUF608 family) n=1 Tax=Microlunatus kandeliicorticis TaxID=1759536 RepID=A0A7W3IUP6_9ACTN|nr:GH116 family glycosyl-hydrolase [Microlunatus kandeliicorticis]MBA8795608.1 uncharacterized protein (DUF608 family) [Microlunatus kandeliicorticis]
MTTTATAWPGPRTIGPEATVAAFPLGGIGTGTVSVGARGELRDWEISNRPDKHSWLPFTFFAVRAQPTGGPAVTRVLESRIHGPHEGDSGHHIGKVAGLPRLAGSRMRVEYPVLRIDFDDPDLPVDVGLEAFTPLVPLDVAASGLPAALLRYRAHNPGAEPVEVTVAGSMSNPIGITGHNVFQFPVHAGRPTVGRRDDGDLTGLVFGTDLPADDVRHGTAALLTPHRATGGEVTATPRWATDFWQDGVQLFWDDLCADGRLEPQPATLEQPRDGEDAAAFAARLPTLVTGSLALHATLRPGETRDFDFVLAWHVPLRPRAWAGGNLTDEGYAGTGFATVRNRYARDTTDAWDAGARLLADLPRLEGATKAFHTALHGSSLPAEVVDAVSSTLVVLRSTTCLLLETDPDGGDPDGVGQFAAWEGSFDHAGSCEGTCTHVWNYAQAVAWLFPALERTARRNEFARETLPDGRMRFRSGLVLGQEPWEFHPAVDGQLGTVLRLYREWRFSGADDFLAELWPAARRALDFAFDRWDTDGDLLLDGQQHNTYDIEFYGPNMLGTSIFLAALRAGVVLARARGEAEVAERWQRAADTGAERADALMFNGEFYEQRTEAHGGVDAYRYQYGAGCLSDQLLGQTWAHLNGLGHLLPPEHVRSAVRAVHAHNFRTDFTDYPSVQRTYALNDDAGLILCSWPRGGRPRIPFVYSDEVWSGIEYQVATHLAYEGFVEEALQIVRAVRDRHDGVHRNPWNEAECGNHYARSMASWGVLLALTGAQWDAPSRTLRLAPAPAAYDGDRFSVPFSTALGWGQAVADGTGIRLELLGGTLDLAACQVTHPDGRTFGLSGPTTLEAGESVHLVLDPHSERQDF